MAICEIFRISNGGGWPKWPNGKYAHDSLPFFSVHCGCRASEYVACLSLLGNLLMPRSLAARTSETDMPRLLDRRPSVQRTAHDEYATGLGSFRELYGPQRPPSPRLSVLKRPSGRQTYLYCQIRDVPNTAACQKRYGVYCKR